MGKFRLILILLLFPFITIGQQIPYEDLAKAFQCGNFKKCYKLASKHQKTSPEDALPYVYGALSIYQGQNEKMIAKNHPSVIEDCFDLLKNAHDLIQEKDKIPSTFFVSLKYIQSELARPIKKHLKEGQLDDAKKGYQELANVFDHSNLIYTNYLAEQLIDHCNELLTKKKEINSESLIRFSTEIAEEEIKRLLQLKSSPYHLRALQTIQDELFALIQTLQEIKQPEKGKPIADLLISEFDHSSEKKRNYHAWELYQNNLLDAQQFSQTALYHSLKTDLSDWSDSAYFFEGFNQPLHLLANTGRYCSYLTEEEKKVLYVTNLSRMYPDLFEQTYLTKYIELNPDEKGSYASSLKRTLKKMNALPPYIPDSTISLAAKLHAKDYGEKGKEGHGGQFGSPEGRMQHFGAIGSVSAENCDYGIEVPTEIVLHLLVDNGISGVGHRKNIQAEDLKRVGIAIAPHKQYGINCVMDFMD